MSQRILDRRVEVIQTNGSTPTTILTYVFPDDCVVAYEIVLLAREQISINGAAFFISGAFKRQTGSSTKINSVEDHGFKEAALSTIAYTINATGDDFVVQVQGLGLTIIEWMIDIQVWVH